MNVSGKRFVADTWHDIPVIRDTITDRYSLESICLDPIKQKEILEDETVHKFAKVLLETENIYLFIDINDETYAHKIGMYFILSKVNPDYKPQ